jgi:hypothetical protein
LKTCFLENFFGKHFQLCWGNILNFAGGTQPTMLGELGLTTPGNSRWGPGEPGGASHWNQTSKVERTPLGQNKFWFPNWGKMLIGQFKMLLGQFKMPFVPFKMLIG